MAASQVGNVVQIGTATYVVNVSSYTDTSITYFFQPVGGGAGFTTAAMVSPLPCGLLDWQDGLTLGWSIAAVWIATAVVINLKRAASE